MLASMASVSITISLSACQVEQIERYVPSKGKKALTTFVEQAVQKAIENSAAFDAMIEQSLIETGGPLTAKEKAWARKALSGSKPAAKRPAKRKAA